MGIKPKYELTNSLNSNNIPLVLCYNKLSIQFEINCVILAHLISKNMNNLF